MKIAILFYLVPFSERKYRIMNIVDALSPSLWEKLFGGRWPGDFRYLYIIQDNGVQWTPRVKAMFGILFLSGTVTLLFMRKYWFRYRRMKKWYESFSGGREDPEGKERFLKWKKELGIKRRVTFISSERCHSPLVWGQWSPGILFPVPEEPELEPEEYDFLMRHELIHIRHQDQLFKYLGLLVMVLHWFNPFSYFLFWEISCISEMYCDEEVMKGEGEERRSQYGKLVLRLASQNKHSDREWFFAGAANSRNQKFYKRRILEMKRTRKNRVVLSAVTMALICMAGGMTCFAYNPPIEILNEEDYMLEGEITFLEEGEELPVEELFSDAFFTDEEGNVYDLTDTGEEGRASCNHVYGVSGTTQTHAKDGKGGCVVKQYEALKCKYCNAVKKGELKSTTTYPVCPH